MNFEEFNNLSTEAAAQHLLNCCGSVKWQQQMMENISFKDVNELISTMQKIWYKECGEKDWLEAFTHHPKIGDVKSLTEKFAATKDLAGNEQKSVHNASVEIINNLANANSEYEEKFGFIFIVCATGKTAEEMLRLLNDRLQNNKREEINIAMGEQNKITFLRLKKLFVKEDWSTIMPCQLTTHVLNTSIGKPGKDITIRLQKINGELWETFAQGITNEDGRAGDLLPAGLTLNANKYKIVFETEAYFRNENIITFYPSVDIQFNIFDNAHYHVPLLINPFGYSTYRGS
ncbi:MAG: 2-oxo-4-hydroxy-4-carboxy-5-ureidoimidazoline decarboxylase [Ferruginibacter sp.]|nr:2-oxo-4-hydroxy-4-carboxy-5-ureidoimidazoline decarboxylase [Ferruginibacter sp.]